MLDAMSHTSRRGDGLSLSSAKVVLLVNMIPPYRLPVFEALAHRVGQLLVWVSTPMEPDRQWQPEWGRLNVEVQRSLTLRQSTQHPHGFLDKQFVHIPYDTIPRLQRARPDVVITSELGLRTAQTAIWCAATSTPLAMVVHVSESSERGRDRDRVRRMLRRTLLRRADVVFVPGQSGARYVRRLGADPDRLVEFIGGATMLRVLLRPDEPPGTIRCPQALPLPISPRRRSTTLAASSSMPRRSMPSPTRPPTATSA